MVVRLAVVRDGARKTQDAVIDVYTSITEQKKGG
jgi:hypothetical protein